jgi:hypothetical protein
MAKAKAASAGITRDEWLAALESAGYAQEHDPNAVTIPEFMAMMGLRSLAAASQRLATLAAQGKATKTRKIGIGADGRQLSRVAFALRKTP